MPAFFIPYSDQDLHENIYSAIKIFLQAECFELNHNRVYSVTYNDNGTEYTDTVGKANKLSQEVVITVFETASMYLICTATRGALKGKPIVVVKDESTTVTYFDNYFKS